MKQSVHPWLCGHLQISLNLAMIHEPTPSKLRQATVTRRPPAVSLCTSPRLQKWSWKPRWNSETCALGDETCYIIWCPKTAHRAQRKQDKKCSCFKLHLSATYGRTEERMRQTWGKNRTQENVWDCSGWANDYASNALCVVQTIGKAYPWNNFVARI